MSPSEQDAPTLPVGASGLESPPWLRAANAEGLLRLSYLEIENLRAQLAVVRIQCVEACIQTARELSEEGDQAAGFGALRCADAIRGLK